MNGRKLWTFRILLSVLVAVATFLVAELFAKVFYERITTPTGRWAVSLASRTEFYPYGEVVNAAKPRLLPHPYLFYALTPLYESSGVVQHNSMGYRQGEFDVEKKQGVTRILALGGSTTYGATVNFPQQTWPAQLEGMLNAGLPEKRFEVINGGVDSACSAEILAGWVFRYRLLRPDVVILNLGVNDIWPLLLTKKYSPEYVHFRKPNAMPVTGSSIRWCLSHSSILKSLYAFAYKDDADLTPYSQVLDADLYSSEAESQAATRRVTSEENTGFLRNFEELVRIIQLDNAKILISMEPALPEELISVKTRALKWTFMNGLEHAWTLGLEKNYGIMQTVAAKYHIPTVRMDSLDFRMEWFFDWYHLFPPGEQKKAQLIGNALLKTNTL